MNDLITIQLAISKLHMQTLQSQSPTEPVATEALAELNTALAELEATNDELLRSNNSLAQIMVERDLEASRYRELFNRIPIACVATDEWGVIDEVNTAAEDLLNVPRARLQGKPISVFVPPDKRREFRMRLDNLPLSEVWEVTFQPRERDRITVQLDVVEMPTDDRSHRRLCWVVQNTTPQRAAASTEKLLAREVSLRMEAQATVTRLRALHTGLEGMANDVHVAIPKRVLGLMEALVPRFAQSMSCRFPGADQAALETGSNGPFAHAIDAPVFAPPKTPGRLVARRSSPFTTEDHAILLSAAHSITALIASVHTLG